MSDREIRVFDFEIRAEQNEERGSTITGRPIVYGEPTDLGWYDEIIAPGALDGADLRDVRLLVNHNTDMIPLARSRNNTPNSTMQLMIVEGGLDFRADLDTENNADAKSLYSAVDRGDITGMSFMFRVDADSWEGLESDHPTRTIEKISRVFEISAVTFPAYEQTYIQARGLSDALESARTSLESERAKKHAEDEERARKLKLIKIYTEV